VVAQFAIAGRTFIVELTSFSAFEVRADGEPVRKAATAPLFTETPVDTPSSATMTLDATRVQTRALDVGKHQIAAQGVTGAATVQVYVASPSVQDPCEDGIHVGAFELTFDEGVVTVESPSLALSTAALTELLNGSFGLCLEVTATVDVSLTIMELSVKFGPAGEPPVENDNAAVDRNENVAPDDQSENAAGDENENVSDDENENAAGDETGDMISAPIEYYETMTVIFTPEDMVQWLPDERHGLEILTVSADSSTLAFGIYADCNDRECARFYVMNTDGTGLTDVTAGIPEEAHPPYFSCLQLNDSGTRLFAASPYTDAVYYHDLPGGTWARAVSDDLNSIGGGCVKRYLINGAGTRLYFKHVAPYDPVTETTPQGLFYADLGASPVQFLDLTDLPNPDVSGLGNLKILGGSADGSVVTFSWYDDYSNPYETAAMWKAGVGSGPVRIPDEHHYSIFSTQDLPHKLVSADGTLALYGWCDAIGEPQYLELVNLSTGACTPLAEDVGLHYTHGNDCLSGDGTVARFPLPTGHLARIDLDTLAVRQTQSCYTAVNTWPTLVTDLTYDGRYYYFTMPSELYGPQDTIYCVDMEPGPGPYGQAPSVDQIAFSVASLPNDGETLITVTATVSDAQGLDNVEWVGAISLVNGVEDDHGPLWPRADFVDDGTGGDVTAGDGTYTCNRLQTYTNSSFFEDHSLPYDAGFRVVVKDLDANYGFADTTLLLVAE
jgi:hypothetical protein